MTASQHQRVEELFDRLIQLPADRRAGELAVACADDADVRGEIERLLADVDEDSTAGIGEGDGRDIGHGVGLTAMPNLLDAFADGLLPLAPPPVDPILGTDIGPYRVLEQLGFGGFGVVYKAEQRSPIRRIVALKVIKPGFDTREVVARFNSERQALARMDHPNIARVLDAGATATGRPYFAMEYVSGIAITRFADENRLTTRQRLELFAQVCDAVAHAHLKAIIHRDIKSGNVLAYAADGQCRAKVIDFGIAKALTADRLTDLTFNTSQGMAVGTYESMSPEQASGSPDIDTRTDVYSLGVLLYELLAGVPPVDKQTLARAGHSEACRIITDVEPARPSSALARSLGRTPDDASRIAGLRQTDADSLSRELKRELEWIPLKALRKERERRYRSAQEMAEDIQNYLNGRPLIAGPETRGYAVRKFLRQNARFVGAVSGIILVLLIAATATSIEAVLATRARQAARVSEALAKKETAAKTEAFEKADELLGLAGVGEAKLLRDRNDTFAAAMTAAYMTGFAGDGGAGSDDKSSRDNNPDTDGKAAGDNADTASAAGPLTRPRLHPQTDAWTDAVDLGLLRTARPLWRNRVGPPGPAGGAMFGVDGKHLVCGAADGNVKVRDATTGETVRTVRGDRAPVLAAALGPDGKTIVAVAGDPPELVRFDPDSGKVADAFDLPGRAGDKRPLVAFNGDGGAVVVAMADKSVWFWRSTVVTSSPPIRLGLPAETVTAVALSPDGGLLACALADNTVRLTRTVGPASPRVLPRASDVVTGLNFSPDGKTLVAGSRDSTTRLWDVADGTLVRMLKGEKGAVRGVSLSPDNRVLATGGDTRVIQLWDTATGLPLEVLRGAAAGVTAVRFSPDGGSLAWSANDGSVGVWDVQSDKPLRTLAGHGDWVSCVAVSPDGRVIASGSYDKTVRLWDAANGRPLGELVGPTLPIYSVCFDAAGKLLACASEDGRARVWSVADHKLVATFDATANDVAGGEHGLLVARFSPDGKTLATGSRDGRVRLCDVATGATRVLAGQTGGVFGVGFSADGTLLASAAEDGTVRLWSFPDGQPRRALIGHTGRVAAAAFSPAEPVLATASYDGTVRLWNTDTGIERATYRMPAGTRVTCVTFSGDGGLMACGADDNLIRLWDVRRGRRLQSLYGHAFGVYGVCFGPDGRTLVSSADDDLVKVWAVQPYAPLRQYLAAYRFDGTELTPRPVEELAEHVRFGP